MKTSQRPEDYSKWYDTCLARELGRIFPSVAVSMCFSYPRIARLDPRYPEVGTRRYYYEWDIIIRWFRHWNFASQYPQLTPILEEIERRISKAGHEYS